MQSPYAQAGSLESQDHRTMRPQPSFSQLRSGGGSGGNAGVGHNGASAAQHGGQQQPASVRQYSDGYAPAGGQPAAASGGAGPPPRRPSEWAVPPPPRQQQQQGQPPLQGQSSGGQQQQQQHYSVQVGGQFLPSPTSPTFSVPGSPLAPTNAYAATHHQQQTYTPSRSPQMSPTAPGGAGQTYAHQYNPQNHPQLAHLQHQQQGRNVNYSPNQYGGGLLPQHHLGHGGPAPGPYSPQQPPASPGGFGTYSPSVTSGGAGTASPFFPPASSGGTAATSRTRLSHSSAAGTPHEASSLASSVATATTEHYYGSRSGSVSATTSNLREPSFRRVRGVSDLRPVVQVQPAERRADPAGGFLSPLKALTTHLAQTYHLINPEFKYELSLNPRRVLTKPSKPAGNDGMDNEEADYILYVNDLLGTDEGHKYLILDVLGQGTFGQVVKCQNMKTHEVLAVKVIKNKPAYYQQSMMEVMILELLNNTWDPDNVHHILRMKDHFIHHKHLCIAFELLSSNLYELIKQNSFRGLSTSLVRVFTTQLLDALTVLNEARLIHCDLKPENILLNTLSSPDIKVIDFGSACHERQTVYTYIQSRFYRSPEVILGLPYSSAIDMWSLGCICVELFLGLPLFPGTSEYNQISRIVEMLGSPPTYMLEVGKQAAHFFDTAYDDFGCKAFRLKSLEKYSKEHSVQEQPSKKYFQQDTLEDIISQYPVMRKGMKPADLEKEKQNRIAFIDFVKGLLNLNPIERWSPQQAKQHPFILGEPLRKPFLPPMSLKSNTGGKPASTSPTVAGAGQSQAVPMDIQQTQPPAQPQQAADAKRPYGGLVANTQRQQGQKAYDAATYAQLQAQQQVYNAQAQANYQQQQQAAQRSQNPYLMQHDQGPPTQQQLAAQYSAPRLQASGSAHQLASGSGGYGRPAGQQNNANLQPHHYGRGRSGTMTEMDVVPPQLQKVQMDLASMAGHSVTPVLRRDPDQYLAWEQRQAGAAGGLNRRISHRHNPQLEYLHEQAEAGGWQNRVRMPPQSYYSNPTAMQGQPFSVVVDGSDRRPHMAYDGPGAMGGPIPPPPQVHAGAARYGGMPPPTSFASTSGAAYDVPMDHYPDHRDPSAMQYVPMVPKPSPQGGGYYPAAAGQPSGQGRIPDSLLAGGRPQDRRPSNQGPEWR